MDAPNLGLMTKKEVIAYTLAKVESLTTIINDLREENRQMSLQSGSFFYQIQALNTYLQASLENVSSLEKQVQVLEQERDTLEKQVMDCKSVAPLLRPG